jgi:hypothetical protein
MHIGYIYNLLPPTINHVSNVLTVISNTTDSHSHLATAIRNKDGDFRTFFRVRIVNRECFVNES